MRSVAARSGLLLALAFALVACSDAADGRSAPSRPGAAPSTRASTAVISRKIAGVDCLRLDSAATRLGLRVTERDRGSTLLLAGPGTNAEIEGGTRDVRINGLRVFLGHPVFVFRGELYVSRIDFEKCLMPLLKPGHGVPLKPVPKVIVIDPGHGGRDHGKINEQLKVSEKSVVLDTAQRLKKLLEADGFRVILTRNDDRFLELGERSAIANRVGADLFVSIHFNALDKDRRTSGVEVYTFAPQHQRSIEAWMPGQKDDSESKPEPVNAHDYWSSLLAHSLHRPFVKDLKASDRGKKIMHLGVLRSLRCPGVLVECGFLSSDIEARKISTPAYRQQIAKALREGVRDYAEHISKARQKSKPSATSTRKGASRSS